MLNDGLRQELQAMRDEDLRVREDLIASAEMGGEYVPRMECCAQAQCKPFARAD